MGLIIKSTENQPIVIKGTNIEVPNVYGRLEFAGRADGKTLEIAIMTYASKEAFKESASQLSTNVPQGSFAVELQEGESQSVETSHIYSKQVLEQQGYDVEIDLVTEVENE
jgi:hypothetical protein